MSYESISQCYGDASFIKRVTACIAQEQIARGDQANPGTVSNPLVWAVAAADDVEAAYESALAVHNPDPGGDPSVITDGMILAHVQGNWPAEPQPVLPPP